MKIGIITHWKDKDNYGAILQTYALQKYLRNLGHDAFVIRYYAKSESKSTVQRFKKLLKNPFVIFKRRKFKALLKLNSRWNELRDFDTFRNEYISLSPLVYNGLEEIQNTPPEADVYITGSDQVWCGDLNNKQNWAFFLDFGTDTTKRIAYAASFGRSYFPCVDERKFQELVSRFNAVSIREENGIKMCLVRGIKAVRCLDSTLILEANIYKELMAPRKHSGHYVFFYTVNVTNKKELYWNKLYPYLKERGIKAIVTTGSGYKLAEEMFEGAEYDYATVKEWLSNIYYADSVITASFHGVAFSLMLQKNFVYMPLQGKYSTGNDRVLDLLKSVDLMNRVANSWEETISILDTNIDYNHINNSDFLRLRNQSIEFLDKSLSH